MNQLGEMKAKQLEDPMTGPIFQTWKHSGLECIPISIENHKIHHHHHHHHHHPHPPTSTLTPLNTQNRSKFQILLS